MTDVVPVDDKAMRRSAKTGRRMAGRAGWWLEPGRSERWLVFDRAMITLGALALWQLGVVTGVLNERFIPAPTG